MSHPTTPTSSVPNLPGPRPWADRERHGRWQVIHTGNGTAIGNDVVVELTPGRARHRRSAPGALVVTAEAPPAGAAFEVSLITLRHLRVRGRTSRDVGWVLWNRADDDHFYAVALKPNGWEISKQDPAYPGSRRFLATCTRPKFPVGRSYRVRVEPGPTTTVLVNGRELARFTDWERPYRSGSIGLYAEHAHVLFVDLCVDQGRQP